MILGKCQDRFDVRAVFGRQKASTDKVIRDREFPGVACLGDTIRLPLIESITEFCVGGSLDAGAGAIGVTHAVF